MDGAFLMTSARTDWRFLWDRPAKCRPPSLAYAPAKSQAVTFAGGKPGWYHGNLLKESGDMNGAPGEKEMGIPGWPGQSGNGMNGQATGPRHGASAGNAP